MSSPRRSFLKAAVAGIAGSLLAPRQAGAQDGERRLGLVNTHTGETLEAAYWAQGRYRPGELGRLDWIFRDHRASSARPVDLRLYDLLHALAAAAGVEARYEIIAGYRSPATNAMLAARSDGVSSRSLHMEGKAIDVRLPGVALARLRDLALVRAMGGVGYYPESDFLHLDVGRVRRW